MLSITNTTVTKEGSINENGCEYRVIYTTINGEINKISCQVVKDFDGVLTQVGTINKENGQVNAFIRDSEYYVTHMTVFESIVKEIEKDVEPILQE